MSAESLSVREASRVLGISPRTLKRLCEEGRLPHFTTPGGHLRLRRADLEAFGRNGKGAGLASVSSPSSVLQNRRERVEELALEAQELRARRDLRELQDEQAEAEERRRADAQAAALAEKRELERLQLEAARDAERRRRERQQAQAERQHRKWVEQWAEFAVRSLPQSAPGEMQLAVHEAVEATLSKLALGREQPQGVVQRVVVAAVHEALELWKRKKEVQRAVEEARKQLPALAQYFFEPTEWEIRAMQAAREAIAKLPADVSLAEMRAAAIEAGDRVRAEYEASKAAEQQRQTCQRLADSVYFLDGTLAEDQAGRKAVKEALDKLPVGASRAELEQVKNAALEPFRAAIAERQAAASVAAQVEQHLSHVGAYLEELAANDESGVLGLGDFSARYEHTHELKERLRPVLVEKLKGQPLNQAQAHKLIQQFIEAELDLGS